MEKSKYETRYVEEENPLQPETNNPKLHLLVVKSVQGGTDNAIYVDVKVNEMPLRMKLDMGADVTLILEKVWREQLGAFHLHDTEVQLRTYTGEPLKLKGEMQVTVAHKGQVAQLPLLVALGGRRTLTVWQKLATRTSAELE